ncbi:transmembrane protein 120B isoform X6 [Piliocolobus tephrosceles]|uniref:transmembrane protein 120B isoform X6 n=1 Tax=Piliocolobus tephrosceles TaxID=591936 RepID=UPI000E6B4A10|nr:transmembrane protein 120B isoform X6 [Piliocolobus tephrosceles]
MSGQLERCEREWHELEGEFQELQETHRIYKQKLEELAALQTLCSSSISKQKKHLKDLKLTLQRCKRHTSQEEAELVQQMAANIKERQDIFFDMEAYLPKKNGLYLNLVLGNVNVTLLSNQAKFAYKDEYEKFKLYLTIILLLGAVACRFVLHYRVTDEVFNFLLVWYYCTLTIRESILISNGSRIKGWWVSHHYVSTFLSGVMLTWPNGPIYQKFRNQFLAFSIFQTTTKYPIGWNSLLCLSIAHSSQHSSGIACIPASIYCLLHGKFQKFRFFLGLRWVLTYLSSVCVLGKG